MARSRDRADPRSDLGVAVEQTPVDCRRREVLLDVTEVRAARLRKGVIEFRALNGPFASVDGLADVAGITPQRLDALLPLLSTGR